MNWDKFFELHKGLDREGPGQPSDVHWALAQFDHPPTRVLDAACGPGADTETLGLALPDAQITAIDLHAPFIAEARTRLGSEIHRITLQAGDMFAAHGPFDLIWCAGAAYFAGVTETLQRFRPMLGQGGMVAFSEPVRPGRDAPQPAHEFWADYRQITDVAGTQGRIYAAGYSLIAQRLICGDPWEAYYTPLQTRIDTLRAQDPDAELTAVLDEHQTEINLWRAAPDHIAYMLYVVVPDA